MAFPLFKRIEQNKGNNKGNTGTFQSLFPNHGKEVWVQSSQDRNALPSFFRKFPWLGRGGKGRLDRRLEGLTGGFFGIGCVQDCVG
jgi:hypothetical protein